MDSLVLIPVSIISICLVVTLIVVNLPPPIYEQISIHDLVFNIENYNGHNINTTAYLGDTTEYDFTLILIPIFISTGDTTIITWVPISDTDYYYALYKDNAFTKGVVIKLEHKHADLLGKEVIAWGRVTTEKIKFEGVTQNIYIIKGDAKSV